MIIKDTVTRKLHDLVPTDKDGECTWERANVTSIALVFGVQILVDIHHILCGNIVMPCKRMRIIAKLNKSIMKEHGRFLRTPAIKAMNREAWALEDDKELRGPQALITHTESDHMVSSMQEEYPDIWKDLEVVPDGPFSQNPVLCGMHVLAVQLDTCHDSRLYADLWFSIVRIAHVYVALRDNGYLTSDWQAMERLIQVFTPEFMFYGGRLTDIGDCWKKVRLSKGLEVTMSLPPEAVGWQGVKKTRDLRKLVKKPFPLLEALHEWMCPPRGSLNITDIQKEGLLLELLQKLADKTAKSPAAAHDDIQDVENTTYATLFSLLRRSLTEELPALNVDIYSMNDKCVGLLRRMRDEFIDEFRSSGCDGYNSGELLALPHIVEDTLFISGFGLNKTVLHRAADIFRAELGLT